jgi:hypothetical protein
MVLLNLRLTANFSRCSRYEITHSKFMSRLLIFSGSKKVLSKLTQIPPRQKTYVRVSLKYPYNKRNGIFNKRAIAEKLPVCKMPNFRALRM